MTLSRVDLPEPLLPMSPTLSFSWMFNYCSVEHRTFRKPDRDIMGRHHDAAWLVRHCLGFVLIVVIQDTKIGWPARASQWLCTGNVDYRRRAG